MRNIYINRIKVILITSLFILGAWLFQVASLQAAPNLQINYQGKLTNSAGVTVADGTYNVRFKLYTVPTGGTAIWTETASTSVINGLFSYMLGTSSDISGVDFNQTLYLGVEIGGTGSPSWDGEMSPRKILGTVPSAFEAQQFAGLATTSFLRSDLADTATGLLTFTGGLISNSSSTITDLTTVTATTTNFVINSETFTDLTGAGLINTSGVLSVSSSSLNLTLGGLSDVNTINVAKGNLINYNGSSWATTSTSSLNLAISDTTGTLAVTRGGTGLSSVTQGDLLYASAANTLASLGIGSTGAVLSVSGGIPAWSATSTLGLGDGTFLGLSDTISSYNANRILYETASGITDNSLFVFNGSSLGVGTSSPASKLDVWGDFRVGTSSTPTLFTDVSTNRVGIGSSTPSKLLSVGGASAFSGQLNMLGSAANIALGSNWLSGDGGDEGISVDSAGNVGIGTITPAGKFQVLTSGGYHSQLSTVYSSAQTWHAPYFIQQRARGTVDSPAAVVDGDSLGEINWYGYSSSGGFDYSAGLYANADGNPAATYVPARFSFDTINSSGVSGTRLTIRADGNIGVATSAPASILDVWGDFRVGTSGTPTLFTDVSTNQVEIGTTTATNAKLSVQTYGTTDILNLFEASGQEVFTVLESGNVGIGSSSPTHRLVIDSGSATNIASLVSSGNTTAALLLQNSGVRLPYLTHLIHTMASL